MMTQEERREYLRNWRKSNPTYFRDWMRRKRHREFRVGETVTWIGQGNQRFTERIERITEPRPGNYVLWLKGDFPMNARGVQFVPEVRSGEQSVAGHGAGRGGDDGRANDGGGTGEMASRC